MDRKRLVPEAEDEMENDRTDEASEESFPASDPPANTPMEGDRKAVKERKR